MLKTVSSISNAIGALNYKGTWDANTNTPDLSGLSAQKGDYYVVSVAGSTTLGGISTWYVGDWAVYNGAVWQRVEGGADDPAPSVRSNSSTGVMQVTGPGAGTSRVMTIPDANFTAARTDASQAFTGVQTFNSGAVTGSASLNGQVAKSRKNYYQIADTRNINVTTNFLSIDIGAGTFAGLAVRICSEIYAPGNNLFARVEEVYIKRASSGGLTVTSKLSEGDTVGNTVSYSISGNSILFTYTYNAVGAQTCNSYVEIIGMNGSSAETAFTVTVL